MYNEVIKLVSILESVNDVGDVITVETKKEVFAKLKSIGMKETYQALSLNLKPEIAFVIADYYDYEDQEIIEHEGKKYRVFRTYRKDSNELEIVVTK